MTTRKQKRHHGRMRYFASAAQSRLASAPRAQTRRPGHLQWSVAIRRDPPRTLMRSPRRSAGGTSEPGDFAGWLSWRIRRRRRGGRNGSRLQLSNRVLTSHRKTGVVVRPLGYHVRRAERTGVFELTRQARVPVGKSAHGVRQAADALATHARFGEGADAHCEGML
jgi:hypothetical protein